MELTTGGPTGGTRSAAHLVRQAVLLLSSGVVGYAGVFVLGIIVARTLGAAGFGTWGIAVSIAQAIGILGLLGTDWIVVRHGAYYHAIHDDPRLRWTIQHALLIASIALASIAAALLLASGALSEDVFHDATFRTIVPISAVLGFVVGIGNLMLFGTQAFKSMRETSLVRALRPFATLVCVATVLALWPTIRAGLVALLAAEIGLTCVAAVLLNRRIPILGPTLPGEQRQFLRLAAPAWGSRLVERVRQQLFPILLGALSSLSATGIFLAARRVAAAPSAVTGSLYRIYTPMASSEYLRGRHERMGALYKTVGKWTFALTVPMFGLAVAFPAYILSLFGPEFRDDVTPLILLSVGMLTNAGTGPSQITLIVAGKPKLALADYVVVFAIEVGLALWLIPTHGAVGAAVAGVCGESVNNGLAVGQVWRTTRLHPYRIDYWKPAAAAAISVLLAKLVVSAFHLASPLVTLVVAVSVIAGVYLICLFLLGITEDDRAAISAILRPRSIASDEDADVDAVDGRSDVA